MLKKLLVTVAMMATMSLVFANVDVNKADQAALDSVRGIGPSMSKAILDERKKGGNFKDWEDLQTRVKGVGDKSSEKFSQAGLTVNGASKPGVKAAAKKEATVASTKTKMDEMKK
ncbi:MAG TPA: helix-hairpin-helix domain-containing protein [Oxalicibacterium sp.]|uniref:ComEA family DNA-binding protein n=1 Tax=Oxalicibacterium sp. TaxID=2766525 RepID=UPI002C38FCF6|nr:helix-hairpin-helix domain-containing protein [Oxalicibacterium sp.]HWU97426.1 helix-hairpin-helix domain-containing protein [Oxalicibacterium sp.]